MQPDSPTTLDPAATISSRSSRSSNWALAVLFCVSMLNFLDRQLLAILAEPIRRDLGLSDTQVGLMTGLSFALFYTTLAIPIAALADRRNRSVIIAVAISLWSLMTIACGFAASFIQLFLARIGVGIGEAGSGPATHSLMTSLFPAERRSSAFGILGVSIPLGSFLAYAGGGLIVEYLDWRMAFMLAGVPGVAIGLVMWLTVPDPRIATPGPAAPAEQVGIASVIRGVRMLSGQPAYWHLVAGGTLIQFTAYGLGSFYGALFVRVHHIGYAELGLKLGIMVGLAGALGAWLGGRIGDSLDRRRPALSLLTCGMVLAVSTPAMMVAVHADSVNLAMALFAVPVFAATYYYGPTFATIQRIAGDGTRALAVAIYLLVAGLCGLGLGPLFVGMVSDAFDHFATLPEGASLQRALTILALFNCWGGFHYWRAERAIRNASA